ncbi:hypothetical protein [Kumtagia ephedrae]|jgi:hypothetical protein|uniref:Uncharacterized protein n=1 Tax=Kumtagia ephedrae TaxID=2116701 RepID=A0A2P7RKV4_9HYPH|nr:hypothetical protein [Mesorhizobium ephedrae]PSJ50785.1 hypothetical protein C7I84_28200 [Mesorhizobium ephedrae]
MGFDDEEERFRERSLLEIASGSVLRIALLFGSVAVAIALFTAQVLDHRLGRDMARSTVVPGIDYTATGSIGYDGTYTVRRSVLQSSPDAVCIIRDNGGRSGDCPPAGR